MTLSPSAAPSWELLDLDQTEQEYLLFDSVICEKTDISGFPVYYYIKSNVSEDIDQLYGENENAEYSAGHRTKLLYEPSEEPQILDVFGITSDDTIQYMQMPKTIFQRDVSTTHIPVVGDAIRTMWNNKTYEVVEVGSEQNIFQGKKLIWEFIVRPYKYSEESQSAEDIIFDSLSDSDFPDINETTTSTEELSAYGDNEFIDDESGDISTDADSGVYGY